MNMLWPGLNITPPADFCNILLCITPHADVLQCDIYWNTFINLQCYIHRNRWCLHQHVQQHSLDWSSYNSHRGTTSLTLMSLMTPYQPYPGVTVRHHHNHEEQHWCHQPLLVLLLVTVLVLGGGRLCRNAPCIVLLTGALTYSTQDQYTLAQLHHHPVHNVSSCTAQCFIALLLMHCCSPGRTTHLSPQKLELHCTAFFWQDQPALEIWQTHIKDNSSCQYCLNSHTSIS